MERPTNIKDKAHLAYIEYLEKQIEELLTQTKKKYYRGIQRQLDILSDEMLSDDFKVSLKTSYEWEGDKRVKVDTGFDSFFDMLNRGEAIVKAMEKFEEQAIPKQENKDIKKRLSEDSAENYLMK